MHLIIYAHPDNEKSHNAAILRHAIARLEGRSQEYGVIDLYADGFDPALRISAGDEEDGPLARKYKDMIAKADCLVLIFPIWWQSMPAILKGFFDRVFSPGFAHDFDPKDGKLRKRLDGKSAIIINTFGRSEAEFRDHGSAIVKVLDGAILRFCGIEVVSRVNWFDVRLPCILPAGIQREIDQALA